MPACDVQWDTLKENPTKTYEKITTFLTDPDNQVVFKELGKGLGMTLLLAAGHFTMIQYEKYELVRDGDRWILVERQK